MTREWVLVSPGRADRPWQGQTEAGEAAPAAPRYDPDCYLCPGNARAGGVRNPHYTGSFAFDNDYPALRPDLADEAVDLGQAGLIRAEAESGRCRVICFSPRHDLSLGAMSEPEVRAVLDLWCEETLALTASGQLRAVQIFENRGTAMGASNPHPHCQIWATAHLPNEMAKEQIAFAGPACPLCAYLALEHEQKERIVFESPGFAVVVPFWAIWPFETLLIPKAHARSLPELGAAQRDELARTLRRLARIYDRVFSAPFPYSMGFHQAPAGDAAGWHFHAHYYPPLLRSLQVRKFMVGFELLGQPQRDFTPEQAAARLRALADEE